MQENIVTFQNILWVLGTGYGGRSLYPGQVFSSKDGWPEPVDGG